MQGIVAHRFDRQLWATYEPKKEPSESQNQQQSVSHIEYSNNRHLWISSGSQVLGRFLYDWQLEVFVLFSFRGTYLRLRFQHPLDDQ